MPEVSNITAYLWARLPLILLFASGYVVYRMLASTRLTDAFVARAVARAGGRTSRVLGAIMAAAALMSFFIPNAVTMLTLLPVLAALAREEPRLTTPLTLAAIYGANIGGAGSLIGSPANMLLMAALDYFAVPGREKITFFNWFLWSLPLVAMLLAVAWLMLVRLGLPGRLRGLTLAGTGLDPAPLTRPQARAARLLALFIGFWAAEAVARQALGGFAAMESSVCAGFFLVFLGLVLLPPLGPDGRPLMALRELATGLPRRGLLFLFALAGIMFLVRVLGLDDRAARLLSDLFQARVGYLPLFFATSLTVVFLTEALSNTVVSVAFFAVAHHAAAVHGLPALPLMIAVSVASTLAFMTPIATPCNALGYGEMKGTSLKAMLGLGLLLNLASAGLLTLWLTWAVPLVYG